jgi:hypothetical protein
VRIGTISRLGLMAGFVALIASGLEVGIAAPAGACDLSIYGSETTANSGVHSKFAGTGAGYITTDGAYQVGTPNRSRTVNSPQTFAWTTNYYNFSAGVPC